jgi:putative hydrolase of the HAD superfamily
VNEAMTQYVMGQVQAPRDQADALRRQYWHTYGATLLGLIKHNGVNAAHFLRHTHPSANQLRAWVKPKPALAKQLRAWPGRKVLLTNAPLHYALLVLKARGIHACFEKVISIENMVVAGQLKPKPNVSMLAKTLAKLRVHPSASALLEDTPENLRAAKRLGMRTLLVRGYRKPVPRKASPYIDLRLESNLT